MKLKELTIITSKIFRLICPVRLGLIFVQSGDLENVSAVRGGKQHTFLGIFKKIKKIVNRFEASFRRQLVKYPF